MVVVAVIIFSYVILTLEGIFIVQRYFFCVWVRVWVFWLYVMTYLEMSKMVIDVIIST